MKKEGQSRPTKDKETFRAAYAYHLRVTDNDPEKDKVCIRGFPMSALSALTCDLGDLGGRMYCNYCGKVIQDDANLCAYCGRRVAGVIARRRLLRPRVGRKIAGVCLGFAEYFDLDVTLIRIVWLVVAICGGAGFLAYIIAWIVMPEEPLALPAPIAAQPDKAVNQ